MYYTVMATNIAAAIWGKEGLCLGLCKVVTRIAPAREHISEAAFVFVAEYGSIINILDRCLKGRALIHAPTVR